MGTNSSLKGLTFDKIDVGICDRNRTISLQKKWKLFFAVSFSRPLSLFDSYHKQINSTGSRSNIKHNF